MSMDFTDQRLSYEKGQLDQQSVPNSPFELLHAWMNEAIAEEVQEPYAMSLATCGADNKPSVRIVLLREITDTGIVFYTNYKSAKGQDIAENPNAEALFFWHKLERQIRISGSIAKIDAAKSAAYFQKRPHDSQVGAWVSQPRWLVTKKEILFKFRHLNRLDCYRCGINFVCLEAAALYPNGAANQ